MSAPPAKAGSPPALPIYDTMAPGPSLAPAPAPGPGGPHHHFDGESQENFWNLYVGCRGPLDSSLGSILAYNNPLNSANALQRWFDLFYTIYSKFLNRYWRISRSKEAPFSDRFLWIVKKLHVDEDALLRSEFAMPNDIYTHTCRT
ncbi:hypothetical protein SAY86_002121 [Trapa natans]|uniref:Uncharacterized protein n=1 Tax=Trapa natans TaxID=22666 RepID=A0AAN7R034_TRANT|nr:hypothetical protein SAY86_002121 [Trapa natans]